MEKLILEITLCRQNHEEFFIISFDKLKRFTGLFLLLNGKRTYHDDSILHAIPFSRVTPLYVLV